MYQMFEVKCRNEKCQTITMTKEMNVDSWCNMLIWRQHSSSSHLPTKFLLLCRYSCTSALIILTNNWLLLSLCFTLSLESSPVFISMSLHQPHCGTSFSIPDSPIPASITLFRFTTLHIHPQLPLFHSRLKTNLFHKSFLHSFTPPRTAFTHYHPDHF